MGRVLAGAIAALLLVAAGLFWWQGRDRPVAGGRLPPAPFAAAAQPADERPSDPPAATEKTREEKRFSRYDKDKDGAVEREEYLAARRKAYAKLDTNGDGRLSFEEYAAKTVGKFVTADADHSGALTPTEFTVTRVARKTRAPIRCDCREAVAAALAERD